MGARHDGENELWEVNAGQVMKPLLSALKAASFEWERGKEGLTIPIGERDDGTSEIFNFGDTPHLLVAGGQHQRVRR